MSLSSIFWILVTELPVRRDGKLPKHLKDGEVMQLVFTPASDRAIELASRKGARYIIEDNELNENELVRRFEKKYGIKCEWADITTSRTDGSELIYKAYVVKDQ